MQSAKESGSNVAASAKAGMEKTKATLQEKAEKMTTRDPLQKEMATAKKEERIHEAERQKQEAKMHNAAAKHASDATGGTYGQDYTTGGDYSTTDPNYMGEEGIGGTGRVGHGHRGPHTGGTGTGTGRGYGTGGTY